MADPWVGGEWAPEVRDAYGLAPIASGFSTYLVDIVVSSVTPDTELNQAGGQELIITGSGFPASMTTEHSVVISFSDGIDTSYCSITSMTPTEIHCVTQPFETSSNRRRRLSRRNLLDTTDLTIVIGGDSSLPTGLSLAETNFEVESITPNSASPILVETLVIQFSESYDNAGMDDDIFTVSLYPVDPENTQGNVHIEVTDHNRPLNVIGQSAADKTITVKYGGAYSGEYNLIVHSDTHGNILTSGVTFTAKIEVLDFQPRQGSLYGGTLLTITGGHFSDLITDNPVKVGYEFSSGVNHYCYVESSSDSEIKCRIAEDYSREDGMQEVIVFASTFEEATHADPTQSDFQFLPASALPTVTDIEADFTYSNAQSYRVWIHGENFADVSTDTIDVLIGGKKQNVLAVSPSLIEVEIIDIDSGLTPQSIEVYLGVGIPNGMTDFESITFEPKLISLSANTGSSAGGMIIAEVEGLGIGDTETTLQDETGADLCESTTVLSYSMLQCELKSNSYPSGTTVRVATGAAAYGCASDDMTHCQYTTHATDIEFRDVQKVGNTIVFS